MASKQATDRSLKLSNFSDSYPAHGMTGQVRFKNIRNYFYFINDKNFSLTFAVIFNTIRDACAWPLPVELRKQEVAT